MRGLLSIALFEFLTCVQCVLVSQSGECGNNELFYGGRLLPGNTNLESTPWANKRVFVFRSPQQSRFARRHGGRGRVWVTTSGQDTCDGPSTSPQYCPDSTETFPCMDTRRPCYIDITPPTISCPRVVESPAANSPGGNTSMALNVTCVDGIEGNISPTCTPSDGSSFAIGDSNVTCTCRDQSGNTNECSFRVSVHDESMPNMRSPTGINANAVDRASTKTPISWEATCVDNVDGPVSIECIPPSGSEFDIGTTIVNCSCQDDAGNVNQGSFPVTVSDVTPPTISCPRMVESPAANSPGGNTSITLNVTCVDGVEGNISPTCTPSNGSSFAIGYSNVTCTCSDQSENTNECSFRVSVHDESMPDMRSPTGINASAVDRASSRTPISWEATCVDNVDGPVSIECIPPSGGEFDIGTTIVNCSCRDDAGNVNQGSFTVTVSGLPPPALVQEPNSNDLTVTLPDMSSNVTAGNISEWVIVLRDEQGTQFNITKQGNERSHDFQGLPGGNYTIYMYIIYITGEHGHSSEQLEVTIPCAEPKSLDLSLKTSSLKAGLARVVAGWTYSGLDGACRVLSHNITFQRIVRDNCDYQTGEVDSFVVDGETYGFSKRRLAAYSEYRVTLHLITKEAVYNISREIRTESTAPTGIPIVLEPQRRLGSRIFSWDALSCGQRNSDSIQYSYSLVSESGREWSGLRDQQNVRIWSVPPREGYTFKVKAVSPYGHGDYSEEKTGTF